MSRTAVRLRPMGVGDLLDETFHLYRHHFLLLTTTQAVFFVPLALAQLVLAPRTTGRFASASLFPGATVVYVALVLVGEVLVSAATMHAASAAYLGEAIEARECYRRAGRRLWPLYRYVLLYGLAIFFLCLPIVGIPVAVYFAVSWGMAFPVLALEGKGVRQALGRSRTLVRGGWWRLFGLVLLTTLLASILSSLFSTPSLIVTLLVAELHLDGFAGLALTVLGVSLNALGEVIVGPIVTVCWVLTYYDLRIRREGFDLELEAGAIGSTAGQQGG